MNFGFKIFVLKMTPLGVIRCGESIARIPEARKRLPDPNSGEKYKRTKNFWVQNSW
jgi:hypothetical protein